MEILLSFPDVPSIWYPVWRRVREQLPKRTVRGVCQHRGKNLPWTVRTETCCATFLFVIRKGNSKTNCFHTWNADDWVDSLHLIFGFPSISWSSFDMNNNCYTNKAVWRDFDSPFIRLRHFYIDFPIVIANIVNSFKSSVLNIHFPLFCLRKS